MALELVNVTPGKDPTPLKPGGSYHFGLGSMGAPVALGTLRLSVGSSDIRHHGLLPSEDSRVLQFGDVGLFSTEHRQPVAGEVPVTLDGDDIAFARSSGNQYLAGIHEVRVPVSSEASVMAHVRLRRKTWTAGAKDWCSQANLVAPYIGVRYGQYNAGAFVFLQDAGGGSAVVTGPLQALSAPRQIEEVVPFPWVALAEGQEIAFWIFVNHDGFEDHINPHLPVAEVWGALAGSAPQLLHRFTLTAGGQFRYGSPENYVTLFFGNAGEAGDVVTFSDWALYRDYRLAIEAGSAKSGHIVRVEPDLPVLFRVDEAKSPPSSLLVGRWFPSTDAYSLAVVPKLVYQPGRTSAPILCTIPKVKAIGHACYERDDVRVTEALEGFMLEAVAYVNCDERDGDSTGAGFQVSDGATLYRILMLDDGLQKRIGLALAGADKALAGFQVSGTVDHSSPKLYRLVYDRARDLIFVDVDGVRALERAFDHSTEALTLPPATGTGLVRFGHITDHVTSGVFGFSQVCWVNRYSAWEVPADPTTAGFVWEADGASSNRVDGGLRVIEKPSRNEIGSKALYVVPYGFSPNNGAFLEFKMGVKRYASPAGTDMARGVDTGVRVQLHFTTTKLSLAFVDAGLNGRFLCVLGSGVTMQDFTTQTAAGRARSLKVDWAEMQTYRVHFSPNKVDIWTDSVVGKPSLSIAPITGLALPEDERDVAGLSFGHADPASSSVTEWMFVRYGASTGYDVGVEQTFNEMTSDQFDGRTAYQLQFGDGV